MPDVIDDIIRDVAELPGRSSPDDWPEAMLVTGPELRVIIERHLLPPALSPEQIEKHIDAVMRAQS